MKMIFLSAMALFSMSVSGQSDSNKLPDEWDKTFTISVTHKSRGGSSTLAFTYDSCIYKRPMRQVEPKKWTFALTQKDRDEIMTKMRKMKVERVKSDHKVKIQRDGWSSILCLGDHCIDAGSASTMSDKDKELVLAACTFLREFAEKKI